MPAMGPLCSYRHSRLVHTDAGGLSSQAGTGEGDHSSLSENPLPALQQRDIFVTRSICSQKIVIG